MVSSDSLKGKAESEQRKAAFPHGVDNPPRPRLWLNRALKNCASRRDPALCGFCKCTHILEYAALSKTPHVLADSLMLVFQQPVKGTSYAGTRPEVPFFKSPTRTRWNQIRNPI
jgi:hypothetical protein